MKSNQKVKQLNLFNQSLVYVLFLKILMVSKILASPWTSNLYLKSRFAAQVSQFTPYLAEIGLIWFAVYTLSSKKLITSCQVDSSRLGLNTKKRGYIQGVYVVGHSYRRTIEKLEVLLTSMVCILDVRPFFLSNIHSEVP